MEMPQAEHSVELSTLAKCAHPDCICTVGPEDRYCSDYCAERVNAGLAKTDDGCDCGHPECAHSFASHRFIDGVVGAGPILNGGTR